MSEPDAVPLPREGEVFFDVRGDARTMRLSWYADSAVAVFSIWQGNRCTGTFRLPFADLVRMVDTLQSGPPSRPADAISRLSADPSFTSAGHDRGYGYDERTGYLPAASYGHQPGYESGRGYESGHGYETERGYGSERGYESGGSYESGVGYDSGRGYESGHGYESGRGYESAPRYGSEPAYRSGAGYGSGPDYPDRSSYEHANARGGPYQGYADQAGYPNPPSNPDPAPPPAGYGEPADYADYRASHQSQGGVGPAHRVPPGAIGHAGQQPAESAREAEWKAAPSYHADGNLLDFPAAPASADLEASDWDVATASYRAP